MLAALLAAIVVAPPGARAAAAPGAADVVATLGPSAERTADGLWRVTLPDGLALTTHGPDPKPSHGGGMGPGDPERAPVCATDFYQHVLYGRPSGATDRLAVVKPQIQATIRRMNAVLNEEALASGGLNADYKVKCDSLGEIQVDAFTSSGNDFSTIAYSARLAGFVLPNVDYTIFYDAQIGGVCGTGSYSRDDRLAEDNANNSGGDYAVSYNQCWDNETAMHENGHNQGAVQYDAPYSTGSGAHCNDDFDVMCYSPDGGDRNQGGEILRCLTTLRFDCGDDTYFDTAPEPGEWLETHWNIGSTLNRFVEFIDPSQLAPRAAFGFDCPELTCTFTDRSADDDGTIVARAWDFGDGSGSSTANPTHAYARAGTYEVRLDVTDDDGLMDTVTVAVQVPNAPDPDPETPTLANGDDRWDSSAPRGSWRYFKIYVPGGRSRLDVVLDGPACPLVLICNPDLDLYVAHARRPDAGTYACRPYEQDSDEACAIASPEPGWWYVGVHTLFAVTGGQFRVTASY